MTPGAGALRKEGERCEACDNIAGVGNSADA